MAIKAFAFGFILVFSSTMLSVGILTFALFVATGDPNWPAPAPAVIFWFGVSLATGLFSVFLQRRRAQ